MKVKRIGSKYIFRIEKGKELVGEIAKFCQKEKIRLGTISGIGATNHASVGLYEVDAKKYHSKELKGAFEIASLNGNISTMNGEVYLHLHVVLGDIEHKAFAGHLKSAVISATFEGVIEVIDGEIDRFLDDDTGLNLYDL